MLNKLWGSIQVLFGKALATPIPAPPAPPLSPEQKALFLEEWKETRSTIARFDDAIMKIRTFGLPGVSTVSGVGTLLASDGPKIDAEWWVMAIVTGVFGGLFVLLGIGLLVVGWFRGTNSKNEKGEPTAGADVVPFHWYETIVFVTVGGSALAWIVGLLDQKPNLFPFASAVLIAGALVLLSIYLLDRFYYTVLLKAAVDRAGKVENKLGFELTGEISKDARPWAYTLLPTVYYFVAILILLNVGLAVAVFGHVQAAAAKP